MKIVHPQSCLRIWWRCLCQCFFFTLWPPRADVSSGKQVLWRVKRLVRADRNTEACQDTGGISADKIESKFLGETQLDWRWGSVFRTLGWLWDDSTRVESWLVFECMAATGFLCIATGCSFLPLWSSNMVMWIKKIRERRGKENPLEPPSTLWWIENKCNFNDGWTIPLKSSLWFVIADGFNNFNWQ